jgi:hypothetical protein
MGYEGFGCVDWLNVVGVVADRLTGYPRGQVAKRAPD